MRHDELNYMTYQDGGTLAINLAVHRAMVSLLAELNSLAKSDPMVQTQLDEFDIVFITSHYGVVDRVVMSGDAGDDYAESYQPEHYPSAWKVVPVQTAEGEK